MPIICFWCCKGRWNHWDTLDPVFVDSAIARLIAQMLRCRDLLSWSFEYTIGIDWYATMSYWTDSIYLSTLVLSAKGVSLGSKSFLRAKHDWIAAATVWNLGWPNFNALITWQFRSAFLHLRSPWQAYQHELSIAIRDCTAMAKQNTNPPAAPSAHLRSMGQFSVDYWMVLVVGLESTRCDTLWFYLWSREDSSEWWQSIETFETPKLHIQKVDWCRLSWTWHYSQGMSSQLRRLP